MIRTAMSAAAAVAIVLPAAAMAETPRETLAIAAFHAPTKAAALAGLGKALGEANAILARTPGDYEARLQRAIAMGYQAQLTRSLGGAKDAHQQFAALVAERPNDPEALITLASWNMTAVTNLGGFVASAMLGASKAQGLQLLDRAVARGTAHALFPGYAAMLRIALNPGDVPTALALAQAAAKAPATTPIDREIQRRAARLLPLLQAGDGRGAAALAKRLMPLGQVS